MHCFGVYAMARAAGSDTERIIGTNNRHKGSLHSAIWVGKAADLASRGTLAVFPTAGWWKTRTMHERYNKGARYSLKEGCTILSAIRSLRIGCCFILNDEYGGGVKSARACSEKRVLSANVRRSKKF